MQGKAYHGMRDTVERMARTDDAEGRSYRERYEDCLTEWRQLYREELDALAGKMADQRLYGPHTHKYKGVAVSEDQFWQFMKLEGFERPQKET